MAIEGTFEHFKGSNSSVLQPELELRKYVVVVLVDEVVASCMSFSLVLLHFVLEAEIVFGKHMD